MGRHFDADSFFTGTYYHDRRSTGTGRQFCGYAVTGMGKNISAAIATDIVGLVVYKGG
jgi:hypothetical protein